jgi:hypothetical protein
LNLDKLDSRFILENIQLSQPSEFQNWVLDYCDNFDGEKFTLQIPQTAQNPIKIADRILREKAAEKRDGQLTKVIGA